MTDAVKMTNHNPSHEVKVQESSDQTSASNHAFDELRSLKLEMESRGSLLGETWSELSSIMTRYQAQIVQKHEQLDNSLSGADLSRLSQMENDLKKCRTENINLQNKVTELKLKAIEKNAELMMKDNLIEKLQSQMRQESMDYKIEIKTLKDTLEQAGCPSNDQDFISVSASLPASKRRKVSKNTTETVGDLPSRQTSSSHNAICAGDNPLSSANPPNEQLHSTSSRRPEPSNYQPADQREMDSSYQTTDFNEPQGDGSGQEQIIIKLAEVDDDSNSGVEGSVQDTSVFSDSEGMQPGGQEQICNGRQPLTPVDDDIVPDISDKWQDHKITDTGDQIQLVQGADYEEFQIQLDSTESKQDELPRMDEIALGVVHKWGKDEKKLDFKIIKLEEVHSELLEEDRNIDIIQTVVATKGIEKCGVKDFKCHICDKSFSQPQNLKHHLYVHTGEKPYVCHICTRPFSQSHRLRSHLLVHSGEKPFSCHICSRPFSRTDTLKSHIMAVHTGEKPYHCQICYKSYSRPSHLKSHSRKHTGDRPYECHICKMKFSTSSNRKKHSRIHTAKKRSAS